MTETNTIREGWKAR